ncbi:uncharacterized protein BP01DRAFT_353287 [Aspergillus saccharolyticus JOP 1030-1]|uniref:Uncharacterized protein n=1 Tax=Aspergillus saccharolyticus JOP 1030-1 TaxID=1450539 RepID=A0A318ZMY3_9EURO|nr:hypothetical protein BP01DRAFT_353287 [Aspergillus saccharolyticus JOP 1030-1]PYH48971.1 hypothetical protein BP01DRAFT_353287 [Aspergillus saccharolyticus JOP 1030-1]
MTSRVIEINLVVESLAVTFGVALASCSEFPLDVGRNVARWSSSAIAWKAYLIWGVHPY